MCTPHLVHECGFPFWHTCPCGIAVFWLYTHDLYPSCSLQPTAGAKGPLGSRRYSRLWVPTCVALQCYPSSWGVAAYAIPRGGDSSRSRRRWGWQWSNFWQCHVEVGLLFCYHFSIPRCLLHHKMSCYFILLVKLIPFLKSPFAILWLLFNLLDGNFTQRLSSIITSLGVSGLGQHCLRISSLGYSIDTWLKPAFLSIVLVHCYPGHVNKKIPPQQLI